MKSANGAGDHQYAVTFSRPRMEAAQAGSASAPKPACDRLADWLMAAIARHPRLFRRHRQMVMNRLLMRPQHQPQPVATDQLIGQFIDHAGFDSIRCITLLKASLGAALNLA